MMSEQVTQHSHMPLYVVFWGIHGIAWSSPGIFPRMSRPLNDVSVCILLIIFYEDVRSDNDNNDNNNNIGPSISAVTDALALHYCTLYNYSRHTQMSKVKTMN